MPAPVPPSEHGFNYRAPHATDGVRVAELALLERTDSGGVVCPFDAVHIDTRWTAPRPLAA